MILACDGGLPLVSTQLPSPSLGEGRAKRGAGNRELVTPNIMACYTNLIRGMGLVQGVTLTRIRALPRNPPWRITTLPRGRVRSWGPTCVDTNGVKPGGLPGACDEHAITIQKKTAGINPLVSTQLPSPSSREGRAKRGEGRLSLTHIKARP